MNRKKIILILCLLILIFSLNSLSATTLNDNTDLSVTVEKNIEKSNTISEMVKEENVVYVNKDSHSNIEDGSKESPYKTITYENLERIPSNSAIHVSKGTYNLDSIRISKDLSIIGEDKNQVIFIPNNQSSLFSINEGVNVVFNNFTIQDFSSATDASINNNGNLNLENLNLINNIGTSTQNKGGSIFNNGNLEIINSTFEGNMASWGAAVYNTNTTKIVDSEFNNNEIYNVGGALYNLRGNLTIYRSNFTENAAVSGAAIYNARGYLYVNDSTFKENDAKHFFGGAIYSTGITISNNSRFLYNHANIDGGAITNTNNFTIINCSFIENNAEENGGTIENVPWSITENGNLTIINSSFIENCAGKKGGVIINYNKPDAVGDFCTVTVRDSLFDSNSASTGGVIYNQQYMDFQNCVFLNNEAEKYMAIYSDETLIKSIDNNWWGTNNPTIEDIGVMPNTWITLQFTNETALVSNLSAKIKVSLNTLNNGKTIPFSIPHRVAVFSSDNTSFPNNNIQLNSTFSDIILPLGDKINVQVDNQILSLEPVDSNISYYLINENSTLEIKISLPQHVNGKTSIKINSNTVIDKARITNGTAILNYDLPSEWTKSEHKLGIVIRTTEGMLLKEENLTFVIPKRDVETTLTITNTTEIKAGNSINLMANVKIGNQKVNSGKVSFKINNKTIESNVKLVNGQAIITYIIPENFAAKDYTFSVVYSGDENKKSAITSESVTLQKQNVHSNLKKNMTLRKDSDNSITVKLFDENDNPVTQGKACYKINYITLETNITVQNGIFTISYKTPNSDSKLTLTIKYGENSNYNSFVQDLILFIE